MAYGAGYAGGYADTAGMTLHAYVETDPDDWYDITGRLVSGSITRGRQNQLDRYQAGTCELTLGNDDRLFDPTYAASPLFGYVLPMKRVKIEAAYAGSTYPLFLGYADRWVQNRDGPRRGTTALSATDGFKVLARANLAASAFGQEVIADDPIAWWRFDEAAGPVAHDSVGPNDLDTMVGAPEFGTDPLISRDDGASVTFTTLDGLYTYRRFLRDETTPWGHPLSIELVMKVTSSLGTIAAVYQPNPAAQCGVALDADGAGLGFQVGVSAGTATAVMSTVDYTDGATHHVVGTWGPDDQLRIYVDGVNTSATSATRAPINFPALYFYLLVGHSPVDAQGFNGTIDEFVLYNTALSAARIAAHSEAVVTPWDGDLTGERIERVLDAVDWPAALRDVDAGQTTLQSATLDMSALEHIQKVAETEFGNVYVAADGTLRFEDRTSTVDQPVTFDFSDASGTDLPVTSSSPEISDDQIRNDVTVSRLEGTAQTARDTTSISTYQLSSYVRDGLYHDNDAHSRYMAQFILNSYKDPVDRVLSLTVDPYRDEANLWPAVLGIELTDRVTLTDTPQWVAPAVTRTLVIEGITHTFANKAWETAYNVSENAAVMTAYWKLGVAGFSELGETTRLYF